MGKLSKTHWIIIVVIGVLIIGSVVYNSSNSVSNYPAAATPVVSGTPNSFIDDQIAQYNIMKNNNAMPDQCVMAKTIAMMYLQNKDEAKYAEWKGIGESCEAAYMESMTAGQ